MADGKAAFPEMNTRSFMNDLITWRKAVVLIFARDEVELLRESVTRLENACSANDVARFIVFLAPSAIEQCVEQANLLSKDSAFKIPVQVVHEKGGAIAAELQELLKKQTDASHAMIWTADQDAPPEYIATVLEKAKKTPNAVVTFSRFIKGGGLPNSKSDFINFRDSVFRRLVCWFYNSKQTDPHFSMSLFPIRDFVRFDLKEKFMGFGLEYTLCFERIGTPFIEIPLKQQPRLEGKSGLSVLNKLRFFVPVFRLRFLPKNKIFKEDTE